jgi:chromosome segregation ATPase
VPREHWAYTAVDDLARRGLINGYPPSGNFFGKRTVTRYEMAVIIQRVLAKVDDLLSKKADKGAESAVKPEQLDEIRRLVAEYRTELTVIGTDLQKVKDQIGDLTGKVDAAQKTANEAKDAAAKASADAAAAARAASDAKQGVQGAIDAIGEQKGRIDTLNAYTSGHRLGGYLQARFESFDRVLKFTTATIGANR